MKPAPKILSLLLAVLLAAALLAGCSPENRLLGQWASADGSLIEFYEDGTVTLTNLGIPITGAYSLPDDGVMKLEFDGLFGIAGPIVVDYTIDGDSLTLNLNGSQTVYTRVEG